MKRPKPRDYGLDSDHAPINSAYVDIPIDPAQPFTDDELQSALARLIHREALAGRQRRYRGALETFNYNNGGR